MVNDASISMGTLALHSLVYLVGRMCTPRAAQNIVAGCHLWYFVPDVNQHNTASVTVWVHLAISAEDLGK